MAEKKIHQGHKIKRFRRMQGTIRNGSAPGERNPKKECLTEVRKQVDEEVLSRVAGILKIPIEAFKTFDEEQMITIIQNTITSNNDNAIGFSYNNQPTFTPLDKLMEAFEEVKRLNAEVISAKEEQIKLLERMLIDK